MSETPAPSIARAVRYGIGVTATVLGGYLLILGNDLNQLVTTLIQGYDPLWVFSLATRVAFAAVAVAIGVAVLPAQGGRGWIAAGIVLVGALVVTLVNFARISGAVRFPEGWWAPTLLNPTGLLLLVVSLAWLVARGRHPLSYLLALLAFIPSIVTLGLVLNNAPSAVVALAIAPVVAVVGVGIAWAAAGISRSAGGPTLAAELG